MNARILTVTLALMLGCVEVRNVSVTFGEQGEGLDGFMCKDTSNQYLLQRLSQSGATVPTSLVVDFVRLGGVPGCRTGQLVEWCRTHDCGPIPTTRSCVTVDFPADVAGMERAQVRAKLRERIAAMSGTPIFADAPDEFVMVRVVASAQPCEQLLPQQGAPLPPFDANQLVGCAYSCPVLLDRVEQDVYVGFDTLVAQCEQGVRTCADRELHWQP